MLPEWTTDFLAALEESPNVSAAARAAGVSRQYAYIYRGQNPEFAAAWDEAQAAGVDELVGKAWERAKGGESDTMTIFMLKCHRPEVYGDRAKLEHSGPGGGPIEVREAAEKVYGGGA